MPEFCLVGVCRRAKLGMLHMLQNEQHVQPEDYPAGDAVLMVLMRWQQLSEHFDSHTIKALRAVSTAARNFVNSNCELTRLMQPEQHQLMQPAQVLAAHASIHFVAKTLLVRMPGAQFTHMGSAFASELKAAAVELPSRQPVAELLFIAAESADQVTIVSQNTVEALVRIVDALASDHTHTIIFPRKWLMASVDIQPSLFRRLSERLGHSLQRLEINGGMSLQDLKGQKLPALEELCLPDALPDMKDVIAINTWLPQLHTLSIRHFNGGASTGPSIGANNTKLHTIRLLDSGTGCSPSSTAWPISDFSSPFSIHMINLIFENYDLNFVTLSPPTCCTLLRCLHALKKLQGAWVYLQTGIGWDEQGLSELSYIEERLGRDGVMYASFEFSEAGPSPRPLNQIHTLALLETDTVLEPDFVFPNVHTLILSVPDTLLDPGMIASLANYPSLETLVLMTRGSVPDPILLASALMHKQVSIQIAWLSDIDGGSKPWAAAEGEAMVRMLRAQLKHRGCTCTVKLCFSA